MVRSSASPSGHPRRLLTPLQEEIARLVAALGEADGFALAGGAALIVRGVVERHTGDLDFFGREAAAVDRLAPALEQAAQRAGMIATVMRQAPGFVRFELSRGDSRCEVDLGYDARLWPLQQTRLGPAIGDEELAADKTLALFGRAAPRDFVDVRALARLHGEGRLIELASTKDPGFSAAYFADALAAFDRLDREQFEVSNDAYKELQCWAVEWGRRIRG
jgi:hypothetical protein